MHLCVCVEVVEWYRVVFLLYLTECLVKQHPLIAMIKSLQLLFLASSQIPEGLNQPVYHLAPISYPSLPWVKILATALLQKARE